MKFSFVLFSVVFFSQTKVYDKSCVSSFGIMVYRSAFNCFILGKMVAISAILPGSDTALSRAGFADIYVS